MSGFFVILQIMLKLPSKAKLIKNPYQKTFNSVYL